VTNRIGFLGGTFDPPHRGHIHLAQQAARRLGLATVLLAPAGIQPLKAADRPIATYSQRLRMVQLAAENEPNPSRNLTATDIDAPRPDGRPNYSAETIATLRQTRPDAEIYFILGADAFRGLRRWHQPDLLLQQCELVVAARPGQALPLDGNDLLQFMPTGTRFLGTEEVSVRQQAPATGEQVAGAYLPPHSPITANVFLAGSALVRLYLLDDLAEDIAATDLRARLAAGQGNEFLPGGEQGAVANYIREQGLYASTL